VGFVLSFNGMWLLSSSPSPSNSSSQMPRDEGRQERRTPKSSDGAVMPAVEIADANVTFAGLKLVMSLKTKRLRLADWRGNDTFCGV